MGQNTNKAPRRQVLVDAKMQLSVALSMMGALFVLTLVYVLALVYGGGEDLGPHSESAQRLGLMVSGLYFGLVLVVALFVGVLTTQRIAGPAKVFERAVRAMRQGDYTQRLTLRDGDHMSDLARELAALRTEVQAEHEAHRTLRAQLESALAEGDLERARHLLATGSSPAEEPESLIRESADDAIQTRA